MRFDLMLFDLDGTLVETAPEIADAVNDTLHDFGWPGVGVDQVARWIGHGTGALLVQAIARVSGRSSDAVRADERHTAIVARYDEHYARRCGTRSRLYPHVRETLGALRERGTRLAIVTNKETRYTERVLDAHRLRDAFDRLICGDTLAARKPDPAGVRDCLRAFRIPPARALFVGDSSIDAETARRAGIAVWLLPYGYNLGEPLAACAPDRLIADFGALLQDDDGKAA
jgi:phosphoglycolate phosphatase